MLQQLLKILDEKSILSQVDIARNLGIPPGMVIMLAADLARRGYLQEVKPDNCTSSGESACGGCSSHGACGLANTNRMWSLTDKGRKAISN